MVLVDMSVWVLHFREGINQLVDLLIEGHIICHPFVIGELACGNLQKRQEILSLMKDLPMAEVAEHDEVMRFIEMHALMGKGLGYIDVHLLASANLSGVGLWTRDKALKNAARSLGVCFK